ncbi:MAG: hypothetical protein LBL71_01470, partial [Endomicrobium sp.]|nr:hypothetical protein [Endomicrobium sp.]
MDENIKELINKTVMKIIDNTSSHEKIRNLENKHGIKVHFIPKRYRILGGILQSMNIQFGNFIERLMALFIENDGRYELMPNYNGKKNNPFKISSENESLIDSYISRCEETKYIDINVEFQNLLKKIVADKNESTKEVKHDIDLLFKDKSTKKIYYLECKYNDDHDTGKFTDINRKFIKTYSYLVKELNIADSAKLVPILFFFTNKKMKDNIYIPEKSNIYR